MIYLQTALCPMWEEVHQQNTKTSIPNTDLHYLLQKYTKYTYSIQQYVLLVRQLCFDCFFHCSYSLVLVLPPRRPPLAPLQAHVGHNPWGSGPHVTRPEPADQKPDVPQRILSEEGGGRPALAAPDWIKYREMKEEQEVWCSSSLH